MTHDVLVAGETLIDFLPERPGPISSVEGFERRAGGAPANVAVALARLDHAPLFWTRVGEDAFGQYLHDTLTDYGLPDRFVERDSGAKTTLAFVTHDETGDRSFSFYRDGTADTRMEPGRIGDDVLQACEWVHVGGVTLAAGSSRDATLDLLDRASESGATTSFDPNFRPELWPDEDAFRTVTREALAEVDVLKATEGELAALGFGGENADVEARARKATDAGPETVFATRGGEGAIAVRGDETATHPGYEPDVVDTTGAGDAFVAGVIAALRDGCDLADALGFANAVGAATTTDTGAMTALPDREDVRSIRQSS